MTFKKGIKGSYNKNKSYNKYNLFAQTSFFPQNNYLCNIN